jgi:predicted transcriptional regulator
VERPRGQVAPLINTTTPNTFRLNVTSLTNKKYSRNTCALFLLNFSNFESGVSNMTKTLTELTSNIVVAYVETNKVELADLPDLIEQVRMAMAHPLEPIDPAGLEPSLTPAQIRKSITPSAIISFEDGKPYKMLRRHLTERGLTFEAYKAKWGLPKDYPSTAPSLAARRSEIAKAAGLGRAGNPHLQRSPKREG